MTLWNALRGLLSRPEAPRRRRSDGRGPRSRPLVLEALEGRLCLSTTLDTRALAQTLPQLTLDSTTSFQAGAPRAFDLAEGDHTLSSYYGWAARSAST
jgi:hypothetical protein